MAYLAFTPAAHDAGASPAWDPAVSAPAREPEVSSARFTALEWTVVALAERDPLSSLRTPGRLSVALGAVFGTRSSPPLADRRLEALRRLAVLTWHHGYQVPASAIRAFVETGFTVDHYELLAASIGSARSARRGGAA